MCMKKCQPVLHSYFIIIRYPKMICNTKITGIPRTKYQCLVLCRNTYIPSQLPRLPPRRAAKNNLFSEIRHLWFTALFLSMPIRANPRRFIIISQHIRTVLYSANHFTNISDCLFSAYFFFLSAVFKLRTRKRYQISLARQMDE